MEIPSLRFGYKNRDSLSEFAGYDHNKRIADNAFYDMRNMSSRYRPCLAPRERRGRVKTVFTTTSNGNDTNHNTMHTCRGMIAKDHLYWIDDDGSSVKFYDDNSEVADVTSELATLGRLDSNNKPIERTLISMGAYIVIFPDKIRYNTKAQGAEPKVIKLEQSVELPTASATDKVYFQITREDGSTFLVREGVWRPYGGENGRNTFILDHIPTKADRLVEQGGEWIETDLEDGDYWIDTSSEHVSLKLYSKVEGDWESIPTTFVKIAHQYLATGTEPKFKAGDAVTISGFNSEILKQFNNTMIVSASGTETREIGGQSVPLGWITVTGLLDGVEGIEYTQNLGIQFRRLCPTMDYVCESKNRIWGCRYGRNSDGSIVNEIYSCALGDPTNWYKFQGTAADSYQVTLGTDGEFTGIAAYDDQILFFKEKYIHKIFGTKPSNFQATFSTTNGIRKGSDRSAVIINETLYYLSKNGVMAYSGGTPVSLHAPFAEQRFTDGVAGGQGDRYFICMTETVTNERCLWCFDIKNQLWFKEDAVDIDHFATLQENIFVSGEGELAVLNGETYDYVSLNTNFVLENTEPAVEWFAETGDIGLLQYDEKYYSDIQIRFDCEAGSEVHIAFQYDDSGKWIEKYAVRNDRRRAYNIPFVSPRCDHMRIKFFGRGKVIVYNISKFYEGGGEISHG